MLLTVAYVLYTYSYAELHTHRTRIAHMSYTYRKLIANWSQTDRTHVAYVSHIYRTHIAHIAHISDCRSATAPWAVLYSKSVGSTLCFRHVSLIVWMHGTHIVHAIEHLNTRSVSIQNWKYIHVLKPHCNQWLTERWRLLLILFSFAVSRISIWNYI